MVEERFDADYADEQQNADEYNDVIYPRKSG